MFGFDCYLCKCLCSDCFLQANTNRRYLNALCLYFLMLDKGHADKYHLVLGAICQPPGF